MSVSGVDEKLIIKRFEEWVRLRPDTYIGAVAPTAKLRWILGKKTELRELMEHVPTITSLPEKDVKRFLSQQVVIDTREDSAAAATQSPKEEAADSESPCAAAPMVASPTTTGKTLGDLTAACVLLEWSPAAEKIFDEIVQNALDRVHKDPLMRKIRVDIDPSTATITVFNDGHGMPITKPERTSPDVPDEYWVTINCSRQFAGGNFETAASGEHYAGGRNGIGMKATNIMSSWFRVRVGDITTQQQFEQEWRDGMTIASTPVIKKYKNKTGFVEFTFRPDLAYFGYQGSALPPHLVAIIRSRVYELAAVAGKAVSVFLDGVKVPVQSIGQLGTLFGAGPRPLRSTVTNSSGRVVWDLTILPSSERLRPGVLALVNGVQCSKGTHVNHVFAELDAVLADTVARKAKVASDKLTSAQFKSSIFVLLSVWMNGPRFENQHKDKLNTPVREWGFTWKPDAPTCKRLTDVLLDVVVANVGAKADADALKASSTASGAANSSRRVVNIPKYEPAGQAGKIDTNAILILTEGDSAKGLAMAGRAVTGADLVGVFCLKGKPPNPRGEMLRTYAGNKVLSSVARILGLEYGKTFGSPADLRRLNYKYLVLLADQDYDGHHIVGLVCNWLEYCWPTLLKLRPDFVRRFATPLFTATPRKGPALRFLSMPEFQRWLVEDPTRRSTFVFKYYKGLGQHASNVGREYFAKYDEFSVTLEYNRERDRETLCDFFDKKRTDTRKELISKSFDRDAFLDYSASSVSLTEFLMTDVLAFQHDDVLRSLSGVDGLKRTQRKLLWAARGALALGKTEKLTDLIMECCKRSKYHHGETSAYAAAVAMAQAHPGTNNINFFINDAQMGDRMNPCSVFSAPRYLSTGPSVILRQLLREEDDNILTYLVEEGKYFVEPVTFYPIVPLDLINGCIGIGTGWNTAVLPFHPLDVASAMRACVENSPDWTSIADSLVPWFDCLTGPVVEDGKVWRSVGLYTVRHVSETVTHINILDLPYGCWTHVYQKKVLQPLMTSNGEGGFIDRYESASTDTKVNYVLVCNRAALATRLGADWESVGSDLFFEPDPRNHFNTADDAVLEQARQTYAAHQRRYPALENTLKLTSVLYKTWMYRLDTEGHVRHFPTVSSLLEDYSHQRLQAYTWRFERRIAELERSILKDENRLRFVMEISAGTMNPVAFGTVDDWWKHLYEAGYVSEKDPRLVKLPLRSLSDLPIGVLPDLEGADDQPSFAYLTDMRMSSCTASACKALESALCRFRAELELVRAQTPKETWLKELDDFSHAYREFALERSRFNHVDLHHTSAPKKASASRSSSKPSSAKRLKV
jgi:DNA topoisomerase-2